MGNPRRDASLNKKRSRSVNAADSAKAGDPADPSAKKLLANNRFAMLGSGSSTGAGAGASTPPTKEKLPPFFVKGFPEGLREQLYYYIERGLKCTIRLCTEGYKIMVPTMNNYKAVQTLLARLEVEYFSHDIEADKPLKVVLRGLHEMETDNLKDELEASGLKPVAIHKMRRHNTTRKFRDQLYLVNLERGSTCLADLKTIETLFHHVVIWERYKPVHRDVTQCTNCLNFGHGTKNCHMARRCINCGKSHAADACEQMENADPVCANCGAGHKSTSKACPKRAEFIEIRKRASTSNQKGRRNVPANNTKEFPALGPRHPITVLQPLPLNNRKASSAASTSTSSEVPKRGQTFAEATASCSYSPPPGFQGGPSGMSFSRAAAGEAAEEPMLSMEQYVSLVVECINTFRSCKSRAEQLQSAVLIASKYGP